MATVTSIADEPQLPYMAPVHVTKIHCPRPGCVFSASAQTEGRAVAALCAHLVQVHVKGDAYGRQ